MSDSAYPDHRAGDTGAPGEQPREAWSRPELVVKLAFAAEAGPPGTSADGVGFFS